MRLERNKIRGVNLGGWLLMEGYILGGRNIGESQFKEKFKQVYGKKELTDFECAFRNNFVTEADFKNIALSGANAIRLPFNARLIEKKPYRYSEQGLSYLDKVFPWAKRYGLGVILDLHAACSAQNCDWHADSLGRALLWENKPAQERTIALWELIAARFKDNSSLIGYDVLNEPVLAKLKIKRLKKFYQRLIKRIKAIDHKHLIFLEGYDWAQRIEFLKDLLTDNIVVSIHTYRPLTYTFNFSPFLTFPGKIEGAFWDKSRVYQYLEPYYQFSQQQKVRIFVGEFGINWRAGSFGEAGWLEAMLKAFSDFGFDYTYWTYKAVANHVFPDGLYQYIPNSKYVNRPGPVYGWETYLEYWKKDKKAITDFWQTKNFTPNNALIEILSTHFRKK